MKKSSFLPLIIKFFKTPTKILNLDLKSIFSEVKSRVLRPQLNNYYSFRMEIPFLFNKNKVNHREFNLAIFRTKADFAFTVVKSWSRKEFALLRKPLTVSEMQDTFCLDSKIIIFINFRALKLIEQLLIDIHSNFKGTFILDPRDGELLEKPNWIGPHARWAAPHIPNPFESTGLCLPIGVGELAINSTSLSEYFEYEALKNKLVLVGPFGATHEARTRFLNWCSTETLDCIHGYLKPRAYAKLSSDYKFVLCPRGNGIDTHRFWETLYRGSIPIVESSDWARYFQGHGVPMLMVEDFDDLFEWSALEFEKVWLALCNNPLDIPSLWPEYWLSIIQRNSENSP